MKKHFILPSLIYEDKYDNNSILDEFIKCMNDRVSAITRKHDDYPTSLAFELSQLPKSFQQFLNNSIEEVLFLEQLKYEKFEIVHIWINVHNKKWNSHRFHVHKNSIFSGVYYYNTVGNDSLIFKDEDYQFNRYFDLSSISGKPYGIKEYKKNVSTGDLLIFRSDLLHGIKIFETPKNNQRTSIAFNIDLKGIGSKMLKTYR